MMHKVANFLPYGVLNRDSVLIEAMQQLATACLHIKEGHFLLQDRCQVGMPNPVSLSYACTALVQLEPY